MVEERVPRFVRSVWRSGGCESLIDVVGLWFRFEVGGRVGLVVGVHVRVRGDVGRTKSG